MIWPLASQMATKASPAELDGEVVQLIEKRGGGDGEEIIHSVLLEVSVFELFTSEYMAFARGRGAVAVPRDAIVRAFEAVVAAERAIAGV